jgi:hypothetical protein
MQWGTLEGELSWLLMQLIGKPPFPQHVIMGHLGLREKVQMMKSVGFHVQPSARWFSRLEKLINIINNRLRSERNRMIHDVWVFHHKPNMPMIRLGTRSKLKRPQARQRVVEVDVIPISAEEIWLLVTEINKTIASVRTLRIEFEQHASPDKSA